jgi:hypothetical protein
MLIDVQGKVIARALAEWRRANPNKEPKIGEIYYRYGNIAREVPMADLVTMIWAALHEYGKTRDPDEATWPLTLNRVKRLLTPIRALEILPLILAGHTANSPTPEELGEASGRPQLAPKPPAPVVQMPQELGGEASTELPEDAFA